MYMALKTVTFFNTVTHVQSGNVLLKSEYNSAGLSLGCASPVALFSRPVANMVVGFYQKTLG